MASKTSETDPEPWPGPRVDFTDFAASLAARRAELGEPDLPRNSGTHRTPSKRALLKSIEDAGGKW
ncbi:hypothetical protein M0208_13935 [Sphingomonas sp. SUN019]|uniref:hypothetical protein n=1 Tax=Sphingomonas sp. SUN019 TaxID=2937788 RepID=UPI002164663F|nr:hypothetical protein [Sphingomonas sp. SUN019]UVO51548.1 hypothetical protein M0208_13935 [Sphingomonas sp. SUN019]